MIKEKLRLGMIGFGGRGMGLLRLSLIPQALELNDIELCAVCDLYPDRTEDAAKLIEEKCGYKPFTSTDYHDIVNLDVDAIIIMSAWESHTEIALAAMEAGKPVGMEVGGIYSIEDCWRLVHTSERTGMPCMLLENCCYGKRETMILNMVKQGIFGEIVHCEGAYAHDLRNEIAYGEENRHYRLRNYTHRNCENYPTHELGPIAKILNINNGNRMLSLTSMASKAAGLHEYIVGEKGADDKLASVKFAQGDIIKTNISCADGSLITLTLDTTLPRYYCRNFTVRGTKAAYFEMNDSLFIDPEDRKYEFKGKELWGKAAEYEEKYLHPLWKNYVPRGAHDGMDWMIFRAFIEPLKQGIQTPIDVYDTASWMCISALSEQSIQQGGAPQEIPDFTNGKWTYRSDIPDQKYGLNKIFE